MKPTKFFEDFSVGQSEVMGSHIPDTDEIISFAREWDPQPFHVDETAALESPFRGLTASGCHLISITVRLIMMRDVRVAVLAALGWDEVRFHKPARPGDRLTLTHQCIEVRESATKPDRGIVKNRLTLSNQNNETVLSYIDTILVQKRNP